MEYLIAVLLAFVIYRQHFPWVRKAVRPTDEAILEALKDSFRQAGLNIDTFREDFDLTPTGKLGEVLFHSCNKLRKPMHTVGDLHDLLK